MDDRYISYYHNGFVEIDDKKLRSLCDECVKKYKTKTLCQREISEIAKEDVESIRKKLERWCPKTPPIHPRRALRENTKNIQNALEKVLGKSKGEGEFTKECEINKSVFYSKKCSIFISYARNVKLDKEVAIAIKTYLYMNDYKNITLDIDEVVDAKWITKTKKNIKQADVFIALLSEAALQSQAVSCEIKFAEEEAKGKEQNLLCVLIDLPKQTKASSSFDYFLSEISSIHWQSDKSNKHILENIGEAVAKGVWPIPNLSSIEGTSYKPNQDKLTVDYCSVDADLYIERPADQQVFLNLSSSKGVTTLIKAPRGMGKTSITLRALDKLDDNFAKVYIDLRTFGSEGMANIVNFYDCITHDIASVLNVGDLVSNNRPPTKEFDKYFKQDVLAHVPIHLVLIFDEIDLVLGKDYQDEFFGLLRSWHGARTSSNSHWRKLNLVIIHSTEPYLWIKDKNQSPFNVVPPIVLEGFNLEQVLQLAEKMKIYITNVECEMLKSFVGGNPQLVKLALTCLRDKLCSLEDMINNSALQLKSLFSEHFRELWWRLDDIPDICDSIRQILEKGICRNESHFYKLCAAGLILGKPQAVSVSCGLYKSYFSKYLK